MRKYKGESGECAGAQVRSEVAQAVMGKDITAAKAASQPDFFSVSAKISPEIAQLSVVTSLKMT